MHFHRTLQTLTNCHNLHQGGKYHYLHITDGKFQAEQLGITSKTTEEVLSVPRGVDPLPQTHIHIMPLKLYTRDWSPFDNKGQSYLLVFMKNKTVDVVDSIYLVIWMIPLAQQRKHQCNVEGYKLKCKITRF